ncbi:FkbM family methyltransferase [bacterium]|nr:FkbM family methyltransferase [bacterium]
MFSISFTRIRSGLKFRTKVIIKYFISVLFFSFGYKISFHSTDELIISKNLNETLAKIKIAENLGHIEKINNLNFKKFIFNNPQYLKNEIPVLWIIYLLDKKKNGYFVEFGACDGLLFSNTLLLEKSFGWKGILAEPNRTYQKQIRKNRRAIIDTRAVWSKTKDYVEFAEVSAGGLSGIYSNFRDVKNPSNKRESLGLKRYIVETISLNDLLAQHSAPDNFDLLSIDTEGSEFQIFENFNLNKYHPKIILIEFDGSKHLEIKFKNICDRYGYKSIGFKLKDPRNLWFVSDTILNLNKKIR